VVADFVEFHAKFLVVLLVKCLVVYLVEFPAIVAMLEPQLEKWFLVKLKVVLKVMEGPMASILKANPASLYFLSGIQ
jgi:hypothetical protein